MKTTRTKTVWISVLNWNTAEVTLDCVRSLLALTVPHDYSVSIHVIDNGSRRDDYRLLQDRVAGLPVALHRQEHNLGFAGGHNISIRKALDADVDFVWLVNSDALIEGAATLALLLDAMVASPRCGAVSPVIVASDDTRKVQFAGARHDWSRRQSQRFGIEESRKLHASPVEHLWVLGTAVLYRMQALREVGLLDERLFAYFEDDDLGARLGKAGWTSRMVFDAVVRHPQFRTETDRPPYYFYLMKRNYLIFWYENTPAPHRRLLFLKLLDQSIFEANKLYRKGFVKQGDASLLGIYDFLLNRYGAPDLSRRVPVVMRMLRWACGIQQARALDRVA
jgi:GT2 family glycosyltransferase